MCQKHDHEGALSHSAKGARCNSLGQRGPGTHQVFVLSRIAAKYFRAQDLFRSFRAHMACRPLNLGRCPRLLHYAPSALTAAPPHSKTAYGQIELSSAARR